jgi:hypothetical protein
MEMAYRDIHLDAKSAGLAVIVATYAPLVEERRRVCREHDDLAERIDELGRRLAELERDIEGGGPVAVVRRWLGMSRATELQREASAVRRAQDEHRGRLAALVVREREIAAQLAAVEDARHELVRLRRTRGRALRISESPLGHELRRIDADLAAINARVTALDKALVAADRVDRVVADIRSIVEASARGSSLVEIAARAHAAFWLERLGPCDRELARARLREHFVFARDELRSFVAAFEALSLPGQMPARLAFLQLAGLAGARLADPPEHSELISGIESIATCTARLVAVVNDELISVQRRRDALVDQQGALEARAG